MDYRLISNRLEASLRLKQRPIAISFTESLPEGIAGPTRAMPAGCSFWEEGADRAVATTASDHELCAIGVYTHNLEGSAAQQKDLRDALKILNDLEYVRTADIPQIPTLRTRARHVLYSPLAEAQLPPDVVLLFVDAAQALLLTEATQQVEAEHAPALGRPACAVVPHVINSGRAALSLGCCGARAYLDRWTDEVAVFAIPGTKLTAYTERIEALANANRTLSGFHQLRKSAVEAGGRPTILESLAEFAGSTAG